MNRVIVYVASPGWELNIYTSIHSLVQSGNNFDYIKVFSVGGKMESLEGLRTDIRVEKVKNKSKEYFAHNKKYLTKQGGKEIIYLDADTLVLNEIQKISSKYDQKVVARVDSCKYTWSYIKNMKRSSIKKWKKVLNERQKKSKMYNSGFVIFKDGSNKKIKKTWKCLSEIDKEIWKSGRESENMERRTTEQMTFSLSLAKDIEDVGEMKKSHHVYGWNKKPSQIPENTIVYHTGSRGGRHLKYASAVAEGCDLSFSTPVISGATHPLFLKLQAYNLGYRVKHFLSEV